MNAEIPLVSTPVTWRSLQSLKIFGAKPQRIYAMQEIELITKPTIQKVTKFQTPDGLEFTEYTAAVKHFTKRRLVIWLETLKWQDFRSLDDLADALRRDWHISFRHDKEDDKDGATEEPTGSDRPDADSIAPSDRRPALEAQQQDGDAESAAAAEARVIPQDGAPSQGENGKGVAPEEPLRRHWVLITDWNGKERPRVRVMAQEPTVNLCGWALVMASSVGHAYRIGKRMAAKQR